MKRQVVANVAGNLAKDSVRRMKVPSSALRVQCWWRGVRVRRRMARYRRWLARREKWLRERERSLAAAEKLKQLSSLNWAQMAQVERRKWARCEFVHTGWHPAFKITESFNPLDFISKPPKGENFGVRSHKVKLSLKTEWEFTTATEDENTWIGVPVGIQELPHSTHKWLGPLPRNTLNRPTSQVAPQHDGEARWDVEFNWIPAHFLRDALIDARHDGALLMDGAGDRDTRSSLQGGQEEAWSWDMDHSGVFSNRPHSRAHLSCLEAP